MNRFYKKICFIFILLTINILTLVSCKSNNIDEISVAYSNNINNENTNVLSIKDVENNSRNLDNDINLYKVIENTSDFSIYNILITYEEVNDKDNIIGKSQVFLDLTLKPNESSKISFFKDNNIKKVNIVSYEYKTLDKIVSVNIKDNDIVINKNDEKLNDSTEYEVLTSSEIYKVKNSGEVSTYALDIKNISKEELGNITLKIGQLDKDGKYIMVDNISSYNVLKPSESINIKIKALDNTNKIELLGYSYDDIKQRANINIDLKLHKASISG